MNTMWNLTITSIGSWVTIVLASWDSRFWGPLDASQIRGRILFRIISIDKDPRDWLPIDILKHPIDFWSRVRWNRFFQVMR